MQPAAPQGSLIAVEADDAQRQQLAARAFYLVGDFFSGTDTMMRMEPGNTGSNILGPRQSAVDIGMGGGGEIYVRGRAGQVQASQQPPQQSAGLGTVMQSMTASPLLLLGLAGLAAWFLLRK